MRNRKKLLLGLAPTRRFVFSAEDAAKSFLGARIGQVSTRPQNFSTVPVNEQDLPRRWGIEMEAGAMRAHVSLKGVGDPALLRMAALKLYLSDWAEQEELDAIAFKRAGKGVSS